jgi:hypothetical protein
MEFWDAPPDATWSETLAAVDLFRSDVYSGAATYWTIRRRGDESFVGVCDLSEIRSGESADIGFMLVRTHWGMGFRGRSRHLSHGVREIRWLETSHRPHSLREYPFPVAPPTSGVSTCSGDLQSRDSTWSFS